MEIIVTQTVHTQNNLKIKKSVIDEKEYYGISYDTDNIIILPFISDTSFIIEKIGLIKEINPFRKNNTSLTLVTGTEKDEDDTYLDVAKRELYEKTGYRIENDELWTYLGKITLTKSVETEHPCFMVDFVDIQKEINTETSLNNFEFYPISYIQKTNDGILLSMIMKYLNILNVSFKK
jgi:ADP-ribose pyrophosphatase YjhB (NUDIX family)